MDTPLAPVALPIAAIDPQALIRDRTSLDPAALAALRLSIAHEGLRLPIEVWPLSTPRPPFAYGLISGLRRLTACTALGYATIPAFLRTPDSIPAAMVAMVSENEHRAPVSPWEKGALILATLAEHHFDTPDAAIAALYPLAPRQTRARLRAFVMVVEALDGHLSTPEHLPTQRMERLAAALRTGAEPRLIEALAAMPGLGLSDQWQALQPILHQILTAPEDPESKPGRPRMGLTLAQGLKITREPCRNGWILRFTGPEARRGGLVDDVLDEVERLFQRK